MKTRLPLAACALLAALSLAACSGATPPPPTASSSAEPAQTPKATVATQPADDASRPPAAAPTCDTLVTKGTVDALKSQGWTSKQQEFQIGDVPVTDGLECLWADFSTASDHGQIYAWGLLDPAKARTAQAGLQADGWVRSSKGDSVFYTEDPDYAIAKDDEGFGMTYEFGDGWVKFSDTKQGLVLITWRQ
ncbi:hypothetical protein [Microbacterium sp.]|uniref:hypothetical protein n=1 Tax=Microbacterium sp. TaxID=51671 RepID=UPI003A8CDB5A